VRVAAIVVAAGEGKRFGSRKQFAQLGDRTAADLSVALARTVAHQVVLVVPSDATDDAHGADVVVVGGATRASSVRAGLSAVEAAADVVVIHDAARPLATRELFATVVDALVEGSADGAIPGVAIADTVKRVGADGSVGATVDRDGLVAVQTPQAFRASVLRRAHADHADATDDAALVEAIGGRVVVVPGERDNVKLTTPTDLDVARAVLAGR
jgi:2-C-methyl-D-erythritol 4-phosphate cytidylyltransferase